MEIGGRTAVKWLVIVVVALIVLAGTAVFMHAAGSN
jgi:hypothetical protein